ncbi:MFS transporter [Streptomyces smaragdinus]|nr:MFS transporter [Streptomyces smaragdinus]
MSAPHPSPAAAQTLTPRLWGVLAVLSTAQFLDAVNLAMVGVALPSIGTDLHLSTEAMQWVLTGYTLAYGGLLLLGGRTADLLGRRRIFLIALGVSAAASLVAGIAGSGDLLIAARFVKGVSAAFLGPAGMALVTTTFAEGPVRNRAMSVYTSVGALGFSVGLVLSGVLTDTSWRLTMLLPAPIAVAGLIVGLRLIPGDSGVRGPRRYDLPGAVTATAAMMAIVYTIVKGPEWGWGSGRTLSGFGLTVLLIAVFAGLELRAEQPLVRLGLLRSSSQLQVNVGTATFMGAFTGFQFIVTLYLQRLLGWSALETALAILPSGVLMVLAAPWIGAVIGRYGTARMTVLGFAFTAAGYALFLGADLHPSYVTAILPSMLLVGAGITLAFPSMNIQVTSGIRADEQGMVSGLYKTSTQVGGGVFTAVVTAVVTASAAGADSTPRQVLDSYRAGLYVITVIALLGLAVTALGLRGARRGPAGPIPAPRPGVELGKERVGPGKESAPVRD